MSSTASSASSRAAPVGFRLWRRFLRVAGWLLAVAVALLVAMWLIVHWGLLPRVAQWKPWIESRASESLGQPVRIDHIRVTSHGWIPALEMQGVRVLDGQGRTALQLGQLQATLATHALLAMELRFAQLHVDGVHLDVRRDAQGRIRIAGMDTQADVDLSDDGRAADWLFSQNEIAIRRGTVRWTDELRGAPALELTEVDVVLRNGLMRHQMRLDASPPVAWGERMTLVGEFSQGLFDRSGDWRTWSGTLHVDLPVADVAELRRYVQLPFDLQGGRGTLRAWLDTEAGDWRGATAQIALKDVRLRLAKRLEPLEVASFSGEVKATRRADGVNISASKVALTTGDGQQWPLGDASVDWQQAQARGLGEAPGPVTGGHFRADRLDLGVMANLATRLPLGRAVEGFLKRLAPRGVVQGLDVRWSGPLDEPQRWNVKGKLLGFGLPPLPAVQAGAVGRPGVSGADAEFEFSESGGHAQLSLQNGELQFPGLFERPSLPMREFMARLDWRVQRQAPGRPSVEVRVTKAQFANADLRGDLQGTWRTGRAGALHGPGGYLPGDIDLSGRIERAEATRVASYLPLGMPAQVRRYVGRAVKAGQFENGSFAVKGDLAHFPFVQGEPGVLRLAGQLRDVQFDYLPSVVQGEPEPAFNSPWPGFAQVQGELVLDRNSLQLNHAQAQLWGLQFRSLQAQLDELGPHPVLRARGEGRGPAADILRFVNATPIGEWLSGALRPMTAQGPGELKLDLTMPLMSPKQAELKGSLALNGNDIQIRPGLPVLASARGRVEFTHAEFQVVQATARALGGDFSVSGGTQADRSLKFQAQGLATSEGLLRANEFAPLPHVAQALRGQAQWQGQLTIVGGHPEVSVTSNLVGMHSDWPAPLNKNAATVWPVVWQSSFLADQSRGLRDEVRLDLGPVAQMRLLREWPAAETAKQQAHGVSPTLAPVGEAAPSAEGPRVLGGTLGIGQPAAAPQAGGVLAVKGKLPRLDASTWSRTLDERWPATESSTVWPRLQVAMQIDELLLAQRKITGATVEAQQDALTGSTWQAQVKADQLAGNIIWRPPQNLADTGRLTARLARLSLPPIDATLADPRARADLQRPPALDLQVDEFSMRERKLGRLELRAASKGGAATSRDWSLEQVQLELPGGTLIAEGHWAPSQRADGAGRMAMNLSINIQDSARLATHLGWSEAVRGGNGLIQGQLAWSGAAMAPDIETMEGQLQVALNQGQFLRAEPGGVGRLLGILSLQALPRRLLLDFRDVFQQGFAFDQVTGDIQISRGRAKTDNLRMRGLQATVFIDGSADLLKETQDLRVLIVPEVNAGAASLAYAAINPAVGLGTFLAQMLLRDPLRAANTREFLVSGSMLDPKVERVERNVSAPSAPRPDGSEGSRVEGRTP